MACLGLTTAIARSLAPAIPSLPSSVLSGFILCSDFSFSILPGARFIKVRTVHMVCLRTRRCRYDSALVRNSGVHVDDIHRVRWTQFWGWDPPLDRSSQSKRKKTGDCCYRASLVMARGMAGWYGRCDGDGVSSPDGRLIFRLLSGLDANSLVPVAAGNFHRSWRAYERPPLAGVLGGGVRFEQRFVSGAIWSGVGQRRPGSAS